MEKKKNNPRVLHLKKNLATVSDQKTVYEFVREWLSIGLGMDVSKSLVRKWVQVGAVTINRRAIKNLNASVPREGLLEASIREDTVSANSTQNVSNDDLWSNRILFEDEWLIVVDKPRGLPTQKTLDPRREVLSGLLKEYLCSRDKKDVYLGLHHRLDKDTSGVILFTKSKEANLGISEQFKGHQLQKDYLALTLRNRSPEEARFIHKTYLARDASAGKKISRYHSVRSGGDYAETELELLGESTKGLLWRASPKTGRTHQIRVHLSELGFPILGDVLYGEKSTSDPLCLHAMRLTFTHPVINKTLSIQSPIPQDFLSCLKRFEIDLPNFHKEQR